MAPLRWVAPALSVLLTVAVFGEDASGGSFGIITFRTGGEGLPTDGKYTFLEAADIDGDGRTDIAASSYDGGKGLRVWLGDGDGGFTEASDGLPSTGGFGQLALEDVDGDGRLDLVGAGTSWAGNEGLHVFLNRGPSGDSYWEPSVSPDPAGAYNGVDMAGDILVGGGKTGGRAWRWGEGEWEDISSGLPGGEEVTGAFALETDGGIVAALGSYSRTGVGIFRLDGDSWTDVTPSSVASATDGSQVEFPLLTDIDGDGETDLVASLGGSGSKEMGLRAWLRVLTAGATPVSGGLPDLDWIFQFSVGQLDGEGPLEVVAGSGKAGAGIGTWTYDDGQWLERDTDLPSSGTYYSALMTDIDGDGGTDLVSTPQGDGLEAHVNTEGRERADEAAGSEDETLFAAAAIAATAVLVALVFYHAGKRRRDSA